MHEFQDKVTASLKRQALRSHSGIAVKKQELGNGDFILVPDGRKTYGLGYRISRQGHLSYVRTKGRELVASAKATEEKPAE